MLFCPVCERRPETGTICTDCGATLVVHQPRDDVSGQVLANRYVVGERIGEGGMATVYRARRLPQNRAVAIKVLRAGAVATDPKIAQRFVREGQLLQRLVHPNIVELIDFGQTPAGLPYLVLELLEGRPLGQSVPEAGLPVEVACRMFEQICAAVAAAHDSGIVHRDLKPNNAIVLGRVGLSARVKVLDFGLARALDFGFESLTQAGLVIGTPGYLAPEQIDGSSPADERSDIYALGALLFYLVTGRPAYGTGSARAVLSLQLVEGPDLSALGERELPRAFETLIQTAMALDPLERFQSVGELLGRLNAVRMGDDEGGDDADLPIDLPDLAAEGDEHPRIVDESFSDLVLDVPDMAVARGRPDTGAGRHAAARDATRVVPPPPLPRGELDRRPGNVRTRPIAVAPPGARPSVRPAEFGAGEGGIPGGPIQLAPPVDTPPRAVEESLPATTAAIAPVPLQFPTPAITAVSPPAVASTTPCVPTRALSGPWTPPPEVARLVRDRERQPASVVPVPASVKAVHRDSGAFRDIDARLSRVVLGTIGVVALVVAVALAVVNRVGAGVFGAGATDEVTVAAGTESEPGPQTATPRPVLPTIDSNAPPAGPAVAAEAETAAVPPEDPSRAVAPTPPPVAASVDPADTGEVPTPPPAIPAHPAAGPLPTPADRGPGASPDTGSASTPPDRRPPARPAPPQDPDPIPVPPARPVPERPLRPNSPRTSVPPPEVVPSESASSIAWRAAEGRLLDLIALDSRYEGDTHASQVRAQLGEAAAHARAGRWEEAHARASELEGELNARIERARSARESTAVVTRAALTTVLELDARLATLRHEVGRSPREPVAEIARVQEMIVAENYGVAQRELDTIGAVLKERVATACVERGAELHRRGQYSAAIAAYDEAIAYAPERASAYYNRGIARFAQVRERHPGKVGEPTTLVGTLADLSRAVALDSANGDAQYARGLARAHVLDLVGAASDFDAVCKATPDRWESWYQLGRVRGMGGLQRKALEALAEASRRAPNEHRNAVETLAIRIRRGE